MSLDHIFALMQSKEVLVAFVVIFVVWKLYRFLTRDAKRILQKWDQEGEFEARKKSAMAEIEKLHETLVNNGEPATAKIIHRWGRGQSFSDDIENFFLVLEIVKGNAPPYRIKKYRPWLPERSPDADDVDRKPFYWNISSDNQKAFVEGAVLPIRVHPQILELVDFEVNIDESGHIKAPSYCYKYPGAYFRWKQGEPDTSASDTTYFTSKETIKTANKYKQLIDGMTKHMEKSSYRNSELIAQFQSELKHDGVSAQARIKNFKRIAITTNGSSGYHEGYDAGRIYLDMEVQMPDGTSLQIQKHRPWEDQTDCWWFFPEKYMDQLEPDATFPVVVHPRIPDIVEFRFFLNSDWNEGYTGYDRGYTKESLDNWIAHATQEGLLTKEVLNHDNETINGHS